MLLEVPILLVGEPYMFTSCSNHFFESDPIPVPFQDNMLHICSGWTGVGNWFGILIINLQWCVYWMNFKFNPSKNKKNKFEKNLDEKSSEKYRAASNPMLWKLYW